jgi:hypothetical protein
MSPPTKILSKSYQNPIKILSKSYLSRLEIHSVQIAVVILYFNRPGLVVVVILVCYVHNRGDDVGKDLECSRMEGGGGVGIGVFHGWWCW